MAEGFGNVHGHASYLLKPCKASNELDEGKGALGGDLGQSGDGVGLRENGVREVDAYGGK